MVVIHRQHCTILKYFRMLNLNLNINGAKKGLPYPLKDLTVHLTMQTYEDDGTTYYVNSRGPDIPVVGTDGGEDILHFSVLEDDRFNKGAVVGNSEGFPEYWDSPWNAYFYYDDTSAATLYHWKVKDFHYRLLETQAASVTNWAFLKMNCADESYTDSSGLLIYSQAQTGSNLSSARSWAKIKDFQNQDNYYYNGEWIIRDMLQFVIEGDSFSLDLNGTDQKVYWGDGANSDVNAITTYSHNFDNDDKHLISVTDGLTRFNISNLGLEGDIAYWKDYLSNWTNIVNFRIYSNQFTGDLSGLDLSSWTNIGYFRIHANQFTGDLSGWDLSSWTNIVYFYIYS